MPSPLIPLMLVDAYNVIGKWGELERIKNRHGLAAARTELTERMANYCAVENLPTELVFDAYGRTGAGTYEPITNLVTLYYTAGGQTADTYIERQCSELRHQRRLIVVTSDRVEGWTVKGYGAELRTAEALISDVCGGLGKMRARLQSKTTSANNLAGRIKASDREQLNRLRYGI
jgi:predicted RNA-binding protein with PIN domain